MSNYIISNDTMAIIFESNKSRIITKEAIFVVNELPTTILEKSCLFYGSTLKGRIIGTRNLLGIGYKCPVIISESKCIIAIPTSSIKDNKCSWIILSSIEKYYYENKKDVIIYLKNREKIILDMSFGSFDRQVLRASRLLNVLNARK